uniref:Mitochondria-eating protein n=1 Tax=Crassostrea virginica TaxID=6565 RepID=A0A8B8D6C7_CRAVI|nr:uncharacterized protein LOC111124777 [Crassostrea virginica]
MSRQQKAERKEIPVDVNKTQSAIKQILKTYESKKQWKEKLKLANKDFDSLTKKLQLNTYKMFIDLQERNKTTIIEPQHISKRHYIQELYEVVEDAWVEQCEFSKEAVKELFVLMETYSHVKEKQKANEYSDSSKSDEVSPKDHLSTRGIERVLKLVDKKFRPESIRKAQEELEHLKALDKRLNSSKEMEQQRKEWYKRCSQATTKILKSFQKSERPLYKLISFANDDKTQHSEEALYEYCALLQLEVLFQNDPKMAVEKKRDPAASSVPVSSERMSIEDIIRSMEKLAGHSICKEAKAEYDKLQDIEKMILQDEDLRLRKEDWRNHAPEGGKRYTDADPPKRPLHVVLDRACKEKICGSHRALREYGSMLHSEVLYDSKDNVTQMMAMSEDSETIGDQLGEQKCVIQVKRDEDPVLANHGKNLKEEKRARGKEGMLETAKTYCETKKSWGRSKSQTDSEQYLDHRDIYRDDGKERKLQQKVESLQEQLRVKNSEIEDLTTRLSQAASRSLMFNNPSIADLSDKNRPTKLGERFEQLYDNEWTDAFETLKSSLPSEKHVFIVLLEIIKDVYEFCKNALKQQILDLKSALEERIRDPKFNDGSKKYTSNGKADEMLSWKCEKCATDFQKGNAMNSVGGLTKIYKEFCKHRKFLDKPLPSPMFAKVEPYIEATVELCWLMSTQTPPMLLVFAERNKAFDKTLFRCMGHSGDKADLCVWPAVILHDGGPVVMKGHVLPL